MDFDFFFFFSSDKKNYINRSAHAPKSQNIVLRAFAALAARQV